MRAPKTKALALSSALFPVHTVRRIGGFQPLAHAIAEVTILPELINDHESSGAVDDQDAIIVEERPIQEINKELSSSKASPVRKDLNFDSNNNRDLQRD